MEDMVIKEKLLKELPNLGISSLKIVLVLIEWNNQNKYKLGFTLNTAKHEEMTGRKIFPSQMTIITKELVEKGIILRQKGNYYLFNYEFFYPHVKQRKKKPIIKSAYDDIC